MPAALPRSLAIAFLSALAASCAAAGPRMTSTPPRPRQATPAPDRATIDTPTAGQRINANTVIVGGRLPAAPAGGDTTVTITVNDRRIEIEPGPKPTYRAEVILTPGRNMITARARLYATGDDLTGHATPASVPVTITRAPAGPVRLDLATAEFITEQSDAYYWLCGESEDCNKALRCYALSPRRVDCPIAWSTYEDPVAHCTKVITVHLRGLHLYYADYACRGRLTPTPRRHVNPAVALTGGRFRINLHEDPQMRDEINDPVRYGIPRFDIATESFIP